MSSKQGFSTKLRSGPKWSNCLDTMDDWFTRAVSVQIVAYKKRFLVRNLCLYDILRRLLTLALLPAFFIVLNVRDWIC